MTSQKPIPLHQSLDVPSLTSGTNSWLNIQPLLRHSFLNTYEHIVHLEQSLDNAKETIKLQAVQQRKDLEDVTCHFASLLKTESSANAAKLDDMRTYMQKLEIKLEDVDRLTRTPPEVTTTKTEDPTSVINLAPVTTKLLRVESSNLALSARLDNLTDIIDKHLFKQKDPSETLLNNTHNNTEAHLKHTVTTLMADMNRIREELSYKCDGSFIKNVLEGKANKQSVSDALHGKANKKTVNKELNDLQRMFKDDVGRLMKSIESVKSVCNIPTSKISNTLAAVSKELREGVSESREVYVDLEQRVLIMEKMMRSVKDEVRIVGAEREHYRLYERNGGDGEQVQRGYGGRNQRGDFEAGHGYESNVRSAHGGSVGSSIPPSPVRMQSPFDDGSGVGGRGGGVVGGASVNSGMLFQKAVGVEGEINAMRRRSVPRI